MKCWKALYAVYILTLMHPEYLQLTNLQSPIERYSLIFQYFRSFLRVQGKTGESINSSLGTNTQISCWVSCLPAEYLPYQVSRRGGSCPSKAGFWPCSLANERTLFSSRFWWNAKSTGAVEGVSSSLFCKGATLVTLGWAFEGLRPILHERQSKENQEGSAVGPLT